MEIRGRKLPKGYEESFPDIMPLVAINLLFIVKVINAIFWFVKEDSFFCSSFAFT